MSHDSNETLRSVLRWGLIIVAAIIIGGIITGALSSHLISSRFGSPGKPIHTHAPPISKKWQFAASGPISAALALGDDGTIYAACEDGFVYAIDSSGRLKWKFNAGRVQIAPVLGAGDTVYVTNQDQVITAINRDGTQRWANGGGPYADKAMGSISPAIDQNHLYTPWRALLRAVRLADGTFDYPTGYGFERNGSVIVLPNGLVVYDGRGRLDAADSTGRTQWEYPIMNPPVTPDTIARTHGYIPNGNFWLESPMAVGDDGTIYACVPDSRFVAISSEGRFKWEFKTEIHTVNSASPVVATDGTIYFGSHDGILYALRPDGTLKWSFDAAGGPISAAPVLAQDETIYFVNDTALMALSPDGKLLAQFPVDARAYSSPTLAPDGTVYVAWQEGNIIAFAGTHGGLLNSAWPKFQAGPANSGRARQF
jgi:outer membrane protein assembly factor BamB